MKHLLLLIIPMFLFASCAPANGNTSTQDVNRNTSIPIPVKKEWSGTLFKSGYNIALVELDEHYYLLVEGYGETLQMIHSESCPHIKHIETDY